MRSGSHSRIIASLERVTDFLCEAKIEYPLGRRQFLWLNALGRDGNHLALDLFIDGSRLQIVLHRGLVDPLGKAVAILAKIEIWAFDELDGIFLIGCESAGALVWVARIILVTSSGRSLIVALVVVRPPCTAR